MKGKSYAARKESKHRPVGDLYDTPKSLIWELLEIETFHDILEPAAGNLAIVEALDEKLSGNDLIVYGDLSTGEDFYDMKEWPGDILTNPPFSEWDKFVNHAKKIAYGRVCMLGRANYFGTYDRSQSTIWDGLRYVYFLNRMADYRTPRRTDGMFHVGAMVTGWFIWEKWYRGDPAIRQLDVQKYATLGAFK